MLDIIIHNQPSSMIPMIFAIVLSVFLIIFIIQNLMLQANQYDISKLEKVFSYLIVLFVSIFFLLNLLQFNRINFQNQYIDLGLRGAFVLIGIMYLVIAEQTRFKNRLFVLLVFLFTTCLLTLPKTKRYEKKINGQLKIKVTSGGWLACGEDFHITKSLLDLFDRDIYKDDPCLSGVKKIEVEYFDEHSLKLLIYHDQKMASMNPEYLTIQNKGFWEKEDVGSE